MTANRVSDPTLPTLPLPASTNAEPLPKTGNRVQNHTPQRCVLHAVASLEGQASLEGSGEKGVGVLAQEVVGDDEQGHGFDEGHGARQDAGVVPSLCRKGDRLA